MREVGTEGPVGLVPSVPQVLLENSKVSKWKMRMKEGPY